jgi:uncharacterized protein YhjY with autotransporter beta-barrel domain
MNKTTRRALPSPLLAPLVLAILAAFPPLATAGPDLCIAGDCRGDQRSGIGFSVPPDVLNATNTLRVFELTGPILPGAGTPGIRLDTAVGVDLTVRAGTAGGRIGIVANGAPGIAVANRGRPAAPQPDPFFGVAIPGSPQAPGGVVRVENHGDITTTGRDAHGISALSNTAGYPESMVDDLKNYDPAGITFKVTSIKAPDGSEGTLGAAVKPVIVYTSTGPDGLTRIDGYGPPAGSFTVSENGTVLFARGTDFDTLLDAGPVTVTMPITVSGLRGGVERPGQQGQLVAQVSKNEQGQIETQTWAHFPTYGDTEMGATGGTAWPDVRGYMRELAAQAEGSGGGGNSVTVQHLSGAIETGGPAAHGVYANSRGIDGVIGREGGGFFSFGSRRPTAGTDGKQGGTVHVLVDGNVTTTRDVAGDTAADASIGVLAHSQGGTGGAGNSGGTWYFGSPGGKGGNGGEVTLEGSGEITTAGRYAIGVLGVSEGGDGGHGGGQDVFTGGGAGGSGGQGGAVTVRGRWKVTTSGDEAHGIWAKSVGGDAGGGGGGWLAGAPAPGGTATDGGAVTLESGGAVTTEGVDAFALFGQSVGGFGGSGGGGFSLFYSRGGSGGSAGSGGTVTVTNQAGGALLTKGVGAHALVALSIGGGGGAGGSGKGLVAVGGIGDAGGNGGLVTATNAGSIETWGSNARGIHAQSIGGGGGDGGDASGAGAVGGRASDTSDGNNVIVVNSGSVTTLGTGANAIFAQSIGGGGGSGGSSSGWFSVGGSGGGGGNAGTVNVTHRGTLLKTQKEDASALYAQSVGGGGGKGGNAVGVGPVGALAIGGSGAKGGTGNDVTVITEEGAGEIRTGGARSHGIFAQSIGGGGGDGGFAVAASVGWGAGLAVSVGGSGAKGGDAGHVDVTNHSRITTTQDDAVGLFAESVGGGGGSGGFAIAGAASDGIGATFAFGGSGDGGGAGKTVEVWNHGAIVTGGARAIGLQAQSVGGGGGSGGFAVGVSAGGLGAFGLTLGGRAAGGGGAERVYVENHGAIGTEGLDAHALMAQSVGGGGGNGGFSVGVAGGGVGAGTLTIGGNGGAGGPGGVVEVVNHGSLGTTKERAVGLFAQSVGGGGGNGGFAVSGAGAGVGAGTFNLGGSGDTGGAGSSVTVRSDGDIDTEGREAHGLFAQSVGGGGGNGGFSLTASGAGTGAGSIGIGGKGKGGGSAALVDVWQRGHIQTKQDDAVGLFAQSIGGGGGNGGFSLAGAGAGTGSGALSIGGFAAGGGTGGEVKVDSSGELITGGANAHGLFAQSVGGGGGNGGFSLSGAGAGTGSGSLSIGGFAGQGGNASAVTVSSGGTITTSGAKAVGLFAQSVGGGGGNGGFAFAGAASSGLTLSVAVGGKAGPGGIGNTVHVDSASVIETGGDEAHALVAQSIGGGGGNGGMAVTANVAAFKTSGLSATAAVGGSGGKGGVGGTVVVGQERRTSGALTTTGDSAHGILAQSVGGGGGNGGSALALTFGLDSKLPESGKTLTATFTFGGSGGEGNVGGSVTVDNGSAITTGGADAHGILAQSIGGGGGSGGGAKAISLSTSSLLPLKDSAGTNLGLSITAGGDGGSGNKGGAVTVSNHGAIVTTGVASRGIFAQSIGGGGGSVSQGVIGEVGDWIDAGQNVLSGLGIAKTLYDAFNEKSASGLIPSSLSLTLGADEGSGSDAEAVQVTNAASITTGGLAAHAIFAQSVGAGGGDAKAYAEGRGGGESVSTAVGLLGEFVIGGSGGAAGSGSTVDVSHTGRLETQGGQAHAIYAQSIGGGGGQAGSVTGGFGALDSIGLGVGFGGDGGSAGNGARVTVTSSGEIVTGGERSIGILAQSIGGGGGAGADRSGIAFFGSVGGHGSGAAVEVTHTGVIRTAGERAHGIFAQSAGGAASGDGSYGGAGGTVDVTVRSGGIEARGRDADAILAQSIGVNAGGDIHVSVAADALVLGGLGLGAGVHLLDGASNRIGNAGAIASNAGLEGWAVRATGGHDTLVNSGLVAGNIDLGGGSNHLANQAGATLLPGSVLHLGAGNTLDNAGTLSPGGAGVLTTTGLSGHLVQADTGTLAIDVDLLGAGADRIDASGRATLAGSLALQASNPAPARRRITIVSAQEGVDAQAMSLAAARSAVANYQLVTEGNELLLDLRIDFSDVAGLNANQRRTGEMVNRIQSAGSTADFMPIADTLFALPQAQALAAAYDRLGPEAHAALPTATLVSALQFGDALLSCRAADGEARFVREGECGWMSLGGGALRQEQTDANLGFKRTHYGIAGGLQRAVAPNWHAGAGLGVEHASVDSQGLASSSGDQVQAGLTLKGRRGATTFSAALAAGRGRYAAQRVVDLPAGGVVARAEPRLEFASAQFRLAHAFERGDAYVRPMLDLGYTVINRKGFAETGAGAANLIVSRQDEEVWTLRPAVEFGGDWQRADGLRLRPYLRAGFVHLLSGTAPEVQALLQGAPAGLGSFSVAGQVDRTIAELAAGVDVFNTGGVVFRVGYAGKYSDRLESHAATLKVSMPF